MQRRCVPERLVMGQEMSLLFQQCGRMVRPCRSSSAFFYFEATKDTCSAPALFYGMSANGLRKRGRYVANWRRCGDSLKKECYDDAVTRTTEYEASGSRRLGLQSGSLSPWRSRPSRCRWPRQVSIACVLEPK